MVLMVVSVLSTRMLSVTSSFDPPPPDVQPASTVAVAATSATDASVRLRDVESIFDLHGVRHWAHWVERFK